MTRLDWLQRIAGGVLLGLPLALALSGIVALIGPGKIEDRYLLIVYLVPILWIVILAGNFACTENRRSWLMLVAGNILGFAALVTLRIALHLS
ncbi:MAG: hypothetical protein E6Q98_25350 [Rhodospirillaceae bacterium]|nr:MAG: hypothetical protein E6Q98_25350 [Rhodospirillaceae bacterium]